MAKKKAKSEKSKTCGEAAKRVQTTDC